MNEILPINKSVKNWAGHIESDGLVFFFYMSWNFLTGHIWNDKRV